MNQARLLAYWQLTHATEQQAVGRGKGGELSEAALRRTLTRPASLSDLLEFWMLTHPRKGGAAGADRNGNHAVRRAFAKSGASPSAIDFWMTDG